MHITVVGAGSLGSLLGGLLAAEHDVTLVGRDPHMQRVREAGLRIEGAVERTVCLGARTDVPDRTDLALVTVKAYDTATVARDLADCDLGCVLSLQNGLDNEATLSHHLDAPVLAGTATYGARLRDPGRVECTGLGEVVLGAPGGGHSNDADRVGEAFRAAGVETTVTDEMPRRLWGKLAVNAGINAPTALARVENGALVDGAASELARAAARETARAARERGVDLADGAATAAVERVADATAPNHSSMLQDVERGRRTEIDSINGAVAGPDAPVNATLAGLVRAWEEERGLR